MIGISDIAAELIKEILESFILASLNNLFGSVNDSVTSIADIVGKTPSNWNPTIFNLVHSLSENVIMPIAGMIISFVLVYELISMVIDKNNMHEVDTSLFFRFIFKACIAVMILSRTFDITMAIFDVGNYLVTNAGSVITGTTTVDVTSDLVDAFTESVEAMSLGEMMILAIEVLLARLSLTIVSFLITLILYGRIMQIYLWISVAPIPAATVVNREWGSIGNNYLKGLCAVALQGFFIMVVVGIYSSLVSTLGASESFHKTLWTILAYTFLLCLALMKTGSAAKSILNTH